MRDLLTGRDKITLTELREALIPDLRGLNALIPERTDVEFVAKGSVKLWHSLTTHLTR